MNIETLQEPSPFRRFMRELGLVGLGVVLGMALTAAILLKVVV